MLDTDQLRSFLAIVDTGSFTRAAERVNKTQSAVSMHMRRLEDQLGCPLFFKHGRGTRLSPDGERLVDHARRMLEVEAAAIFDLKGQGLAGRVTLGIPDDYADPFLPDIVARFTRLHPLVELSIVCHPSVDLAERSLTGEVDVAVVTGCDRITGLEPLREEPLRWVVAARSTGVEEQRPLPLALSTPTCAWRNAALEALDKAGVAHRIFLTSTNYAALAPIVRAGLALTVLPQAALDPQNHRVVGAAAGLPALPNVSIGLLRSAFGHSKEAEALAGAIRASVESLPTPMLDAA